MSPRCYTLAKVLELLDMPRRTFYDLLAKGELPFIEELQPRLGRHPRYRAEHVDTYLANRWTGPRAFRRSA